MSILEDPNVVIEDFSPAPAFADGLMLHIDATVEQVRQALIESGKWTNEKEGRLHYKEGVARIFPFDYCPGWAGNFPTLPPSVMGTVVFWSFLLGEDRKPETFAPNTPDRSVIASQAFNDFQALCTERGWRVTVHG